MTDRSPAGPPPLPWLAWTVGERVVVRYREPDGVHDALGHLLEVTPEAVVVRTRRGDVRVVAESMITGRRVPPAPFRAPDLRVPELRTPDRGTPDLGPPEPTG